MNKIFPTVIVADQPTIIGHVYPRAAMEKAIKDFNAKTDSYGTIGSDWSDVLSTDITNWSHRTNSLHMDDDGRVTVDVDVMSSPKGMIAKDLDEAFGLRGLLIMMGIVDEDTKVVSEFSISSVNLIPEENHKNRSATQEPLSQRRILTW